MKYAHCQRLWNGIFGPKVISWIWLVVILLVVASVRLRLASSPLERDEGEYAYMGQQMLHSIPPYQEAANMKFPGTYAAYALIEAVFGQTAEGIHYGLLMINAATILLLYHIGKTLFADHILALMSAAIYAVATLSYSFLGQAAHATHFVVFFGLSGWAVLQWVLPRNSTLGLVFAGFLTGCAYMAKQSGAFFVPFGCCVIYYNSIYCQLSLLYLCRNVTFFLLGGFAPFAMTVFVLDQFDCLDVFVFWTFHYASTYGKPLAQALPILLFQLREIFQLGFGGSVLILATPALMPALARYLGVSRLVHRQLLLLTLFSLCGVSLGFYFRNHYWLQVLPLASLLSALTLKYLAAWGCSLLSVSYRATFAFTALGIIFGSSLLICEARRYFAVEPTEVVRHVYSGCPFPEAVMIADYIAQHSAPTDRVFVFGSEPEIYFYAKRRACTTCLYLYSLLEDQPYASQMQKSMVAEVERGAPRYIVDVHVTGLAPEAEVSLPLFQWKIAYLADHYRPVSLVYNDGSGNILVQGEDVKDYLGSPHWSLAVWENVDDIRTSHKVYGNSACK